MKLIYIEWEDAIASSGWHNQDDMDSFADKESIIVKQIGWLYKQSKSYIVLVSRLSLWADNDMEYGNLQKIPKTWIRKRIDLTEHIKDSEETTSSPSRKSY